MVPVPQLDAVVDLLKNKKVSHWVDDDAISLDGEAAVAVVNLGRDVDAAAVQRLLDDAD